MPAETKTVSLPSLPTGLEFEELVAAAFQTSGYYIERDLIERQGIELLQLDLLCTDYSTSPPEQTLVEAKSGDNWGFGDIFKVLGWKTYLNVEQAALVTSKSKDRMETYQ